MSRLTSVLTQRNRWIVVSGLCVVMTIAFTLLSSQFSFATDWQDFYQFRHSSSLPGNLFGVSPQGQVGFAGALQQNIPVAYTPAKDNWVIGGNSGSNSSSIEIGWGGADVNGTAFLGAGWGKSGQGIYSSFMATGSDIAEAYNLQFQLTPGADNQPAFAVGVQDILNQRENRAGDPYGARSIYGVATRPISGLFNGYASLGYGDGRFGSSLFGGVSIPLDDTLTLVAEYDGLGVNAGIAVSGLDTATDQDWITLGYFGYSDLDRPVVGLTITKH